jgi:hypothetical protein
MRMLLECEDDVVVVVVVEVTVCSRFQCAFKPDCYDADRKEHYDTGFSCENERRN